MHAVAGTDFSDFELSDQSDDEDEEKEAEEDIMKREEQSDEDSDYSDGEENTGEVTYNHEVNPFITGEMERDIESLTVPQIYDEEEEGEDGRRVRSKTVNMSEKDMAVAQDYLFGVDASFMSSFSPLIQRTLSITSASTLQLRKHRIAMAIQRFQRFEGDTGSPACTVAAMTGRYIYMYTQ
jgi:hypothetical protein